MFFCLLDLNLLKKFKMSIKSFKNTAQVITLKVTRKTFQREKMLNAVIFNA